MAKRSRRAWRFAVILVVLSLTLTATLATVQWLQARHQRSIEARLDRYEPLIWRHAQANALPVELVRAVIRAESGGDPTAVSARNARGLMQITPIAEREVLRRDGESNTGDLFDPDYNLRIGTAYLRQLIDAFDGDLHLALAAYNWGPTNVSKLRKKYPDEPGIELVQRRAPAVTRRYCREILGDKAVTLPPRR